MNHGRYEELVQNVPGLFINQCVICERRWADCEQAHCCDHCKRYHVRICKDCGMKFLVHASHWLDGLSPRADLDRCLDCRPRKPTSRGAYSTVKPKRLLLVNFKAPSHDAGFENIERAYEDTQCLGDC